MVAREVSAGTAGATACRLALAALLLVACKSNDSGGAGGSGGSGGSAGSTGGAGGAGGTRRQRRFPGGGRGTRRSHPRDGDRGAGQLLAGSVPGLRGARRRSGGGDHRAGGRQPRRRGGEDHGRPRRLDRGDAALGRGRPAPVRPPGGGRHCTRRQGSARSDLRLATGHPLLHRAGAGGPALQAAELRHPDAAKRARPGHAGVPAVLQRYRQRMRRHRTHQRHGELGGAGRRSRRARPAQAGLRRRGGRRRRPPGPRTGGRLGARQGQLPRAGRQCRLRRIGLHQQPGGAELPGLFPVLPGQRRPRT